MMKPVYHDPDGKLHETLPYLVQVRSTYPFFETIAAFNVLTAAERYAMECAATIPVFEYRVSMPRKKRGA